MTGDYWNKRTKYLSTFYLMKNSGLNFRKFPVTNGKNISEEDSLAWYTEIFRTFLTENFRSPYCPEFLVEWSAFRKLAGFSGKFPRKCLVKWKASLGVRGRLKRRNLRWVSVEDFYYS